MGFCERLRTKKSQVCYGRDFWNIGSFHIGNGVAIVHINIMKFKQRVGAAESRRKLSKGPLEDAVFECWLFKKTLQS